MCIRHELSQAQTAPAPLATTAASFSSSIAAETSAFFTANVPPNPQHSSASGSSTSSTPGTARSRRSGASPTRSSRSEWQVGWYATVPSIGRPDIVDAEHAGEELRELPRPRGNAAIVAAEQPGEVLPHLRRTRARRRHDRVEAVEDLDESAGELLRLAGVARVGMHLAAAGLLEREHDLDPEPLEHGHGCLPDLREERVGEARDEEGDAIDHRG